MSNTVPPPGFPPGPPSGYNPSQQPWQPRHRRRGCLYASLGAAGFVVLLIIAIVIGVAVGGGNKTSKTAAPSSGKAASSGMAASAAPSATAPGNSLSGPVGTVHQVSDGNGSKYTVKLDKVLSPAAPDNSFDSAGGGKYLVGVKFTIEGVSGNSSDDANSDAVVQGSDGQVYTAAFNGLAAGTNFNAGQFTVGPGAREIGWVAFALPRRVQVSSVQWNPDLFGGSPATWESS